MLNKDQIRLEIKRLIHSRLAKNSLKMGGGVVVSQLLNLIYIPFFSRMFAQEPYALQGNFISLLNIFYVVASLGMATALAIPRKDKDIDTILGVVLWFAFFLSLGTGLVLVLSVVFSQNWLYFIFKDDSLLLVVLFPLAIFTRTIMYVYEARIALLGNFKILSLSKIYGAIVYGATVFGVYYLVGFSKLGLILGNVISYAIVAAILFLFYKVNFFKVSIANIRSVFARYKDFVFYSMPNSMMNALSNSVPVILLLTFYGEKIAGDYAIALKLVAVPVSFMAASLRSVYLNRLSEVYKSTKRNFYGLIKKILWYSHGISLVIFSLIFVVSPFLTTYVLGPEWNETYKYIQLLCPWYLLLIGNTPLSFVFNLIERQRENFIRELLLLVFRITAIVASYYLGYSGFFAVASFVVVSVVFNLILSWMILDYSKKVSISKA